MMLKIHNMSGAGNLFNVIDNREYGLTMEQMTKLVPEIARKTQKDSFTSEGVMFVNNSIDYDFEVSFFNTDGTSGMMCGNGGRCAVRFAVDMNFLKQNSTTFYMAGNQYHAKVRKNTIILALPSPMLIDTTFEYELEGNKLRCGLFDVGSDHFVIFDKDLGIHFDDDINFIEKARKIRYDFGSFPRGINVNLISSSDSGLKIKTYERGIERITGACGTGSVSAAIYSHITSGLAIPIKLIPPSGSELFVNFGIDAHHQISDLSLEGNSEFIGEVEISL